MSEVVVSALVGVLSSLAASLVWLMSLRLVRPVIELSPYIVESVREEPTFQIKIINRARRSAVSLFFELAVIRPKRTKGGIVKSRRMVPIAGPPPLILPGRTAADDDNCYRLLIKQPLRDLLEHGADSHLRLRVYAQHEVSGVGRVFERVYHDPQTELLRGRFSKGQSFEVVT